VRINLYSERIRPEPEMTFDFAPGVWTSHSPCAEYCERIAQDPEFLPRIMEIAEELKEMIVSEYEEKVQFIPNRIDVVFTTFPTTFTIQRIA
jgi:hypothetical protein